MSEILISLRLGWHVVVRNWVVYKKDFVANISPTLADPALLLTSLGMGLSPFIGDINGLSYAQYLAPGMVARLRSSLRFSTAATASTSA